MQGRALYSYHGGVAIGMLIITLGTLFTWWAEPTPVIEQVAHWHKVDTRYENFPEGSSNFTYDIDWVGGLHGFIGESIEVPVVHRFSEDRETIMLTVSADKGPIKVRPRLGLCAGSYKSTATRTLIFTLPEGETRFDAVRYKMSDYGNDDTMFFNATSTDADGEEQRMTGIQLENVHNTLHVAPLNRTVASFEVGNGGLNCVGFVSLIDFPE